MLKPMRRVITGHDSQGRSIIAGDAASPHTIAISETPAFGMTDLWVTHDAPADNAGPADPAARKIVLEPPPRGTIFRTVEFPPDAQIAGKFDRVAAFEAIGAREALDPDGLAASRHASHALPRLRDRALRRDLGGHGRGRDPPARR
jgi:hypothetical protein